MKQVGCHSSLIIHLPLPDVAFQMLDPNLRVVRNTRVNFQNHAQQIVHPCEYLADDHPKVRQVQAFNNFVQLIQNDLINLMTL